MVRLYHSTRHDHYVVVEKSLVETDIPGKTFHSTGAPWVAVLEKAMTAIDTSGADHATRGGRYDPRGAHYSRLKSGRSHVAFKALLGVEVMYDIVTPGEYHVDPTNPFQVHLSNILSGEPDRRPPPGVMVELFQGLVLQIRAELFYAHAWARFVGAVAQGMGGVGGIEEPYPARVRTTYMGAATGAKPLRQEDFERFCSTCWAPWAMRQISSVGHFASRST